MRKRLQEVEADKARCEEQLSAAETRIDRLKSSTVIAMQAQASSSPKEAPAMEDIQPGSGSPQAHSDSPPVRIRRLRWSVTDAWSSILS